MPGEKNNTLFLFTAAYPYGHKNEPFLENEIEYLAREFKEVVIFPHTKPSNEKRVVPENVTINNCMAEADQNPKKKHLLLNIFFTLKILLYSARSLRRIRSFWLNHKLLLDIISIGIIQGTALKKELKNKDLDNTIFYDYWFFNANFSIQYLRKNRKIKKYICRAHRFDIYDESWPTVNVPFLEWRLKNIDEVYFISKHGLNYIKDKLDRADYNKKLKQSYLGVRRPVFDKNRRKCDELFTIVSCARVVDFKRVHLIPKVLCKIKSKIKWIHFGDGPLFSELEKNCKNLPEHVEFELKGHTSNTEVHNFYKSCKPDLFMSISVSEGLPVSMMEAIGYGVPILAVDAGGINEIVSDQTGELLRHDIKLERIAKTLDEFIDNKSFQEENVKAFFDNNFSAGKNYGKFILALKS
tara:strand:- start:57657 stop:58889 length:1233 start_codon:yes stop_codon:yes gene_type:complete